MFRFELDLPPGSCDEHSPTQKHRGVDAQWRDFQWFGLSRRRCQERGLPSFIQSRVPALFLRHAQRLSLDEFFSPRRNRLLLACDAKLNLEAGTQLSRRLPQIARPAPGFRHLNPTRGYAYPIEREFKLDALKAQLAFLVRQQGRWKKPWKKAWKLARRSYSAEGAQAGTAFIMDELPSHRFEQDATGIGRLHGSSNPWILGTMCLAHQKITTLTNKLLTPRVLSHLYRIVHVDNTTLST